MKLFNHSDRQKWDAFVSIGVGLVRRNRWKAYKDHQRRFVRVIDAFLRKYGEHPRLLATRADMMQRPSSKIPYLLKAYRLAKLTKDKQEMVFTAHSIAQVYLDRQQLQHAPVWVKRLKANLLNHRDKSCNAWCSEMEEEIRERQGDRALTIVYGHKELCASKTPDGVKVVREQGHERR